MKSKVIAMHLPQFHEIKENNEWWGQGFTEWTNLQKKNRYTDGLQPLNDNYYNLLDKATMQWQCDLAKKYGVYGFCYYHYYFEGKMLLEKPAENLLKWKDIDQKFCFSWANHSWQRTWDGNRVVLQEQTYGDETAWQAHFDYLKDFFLDDRYIKIDNKPIFMVFLFWHDNEKYIKFLSDKCKDIGFDGIYFIQTILGLDQIEKVTDEVAAVVIREPICATEQLDRDMFVPFRKVRSLFVKKINKFLKFKSLTLRYNGDKMMKKSMEIAKTFKYDKKPVYLGAYSMWDNTYRHKSRGYKISKPSKEVYVQYLRTLKEVSEKNNIEYIFFNAWNEWAEGMILEPDKENGYFFLEGIKEVFGGNE